MKLGIPWNFRPEAPREANSSTYDEVGVEIWHLEESTMTLQCRYGTIDADEWEDDNALKEFAKNRAPVAQKWRKPSPFGTEFACFSHLLWFGEGRFRKFALDRSQLREWPAVWIGFPSDQKKVAPVLEKIWKRHRYWKGKAQEELNAGLESLTEKQLVFREYEFMTETLDEEIRRLICGMQPWQEELEARQEREEETGDLMTGLENTLKVMAMNASKMIPISEKTEGSIGVHHWANRERLCLDLIELISLQNRSTQQMNGPDEGNTLGQSNTLLYGEGHGPPWKGRVTPLVPAGKAGARGSEQISSDCSQSALFSCLPTGLDQCASHAELSQAHESAVSSSSSCLEGRVENHDRKLPMVTSALSTKSFDGTSGRGSHSGRRRCSIMGDRIFDGTGEPSRGCT
jgi:hypothetical protein